MRILMRLGALAVLALSLAACIVESDKPLSSGANAAPEPRLTGRWVDTEKGRASVTVTPDAATGGRAMTIVYREVGEKPGEVAQATMRGWRTTIDGRDYLDLETVAVEGPDGFKRSIPKRLIVAYEIAANGELTIRFLSRNAFAAAVREGKLKGTVEPGDFGAVKVTASAEELLAFLRAQGEAALEKSGGKMRRAS